jgi:mRNA interferase MazF
MYAKTLSLNINLVFQCHRGNIVATCILDSIRYWLFQKQILQLGFDIVGQLTGFIGFLGTTNHNVFNERSGTVISVAVISQPQRAGCPLTLELVDTKLPKKSWVKISQIRILSTKRIGKKIE